MSGTAGTQRSAQAGIAALAAEMTAHGIERDAPPRAVMAMLGDRWTHLILLVLETGEWRHADLRRVLAQLSAEQAISQRVLTEKLRSLERYGFVQRAVTDHVPPHVSYRLTEIGQGLVAQSRRTLDWINRHAAQILQARDGFDAQRVGLCI